MARADLALLLACAVAAVAPLALHEGANAQTHDGFPGWPASFEQHTLMALPLTPLERRFQQNFPGRLARFSDGRREIILRWVAEPSRKLHSSSDCFKANGYALQPQALKVVGQQRWSRFIAARGGERLLVSERIVDQAGQQWSDVSAWYWAAQLGQSRGPWWAVTVAQAAPP